jgi:hypothetical protein
VDRLSPLNAKTPASTGENSPGGFLKTIWGGKSKGDTDSTAWQLAYFANLVGLQRESRRFW